MIQPTPAGWERLEAPGRLYPVVFVREIEGLCYRIAPDTGGGWTVDVYNLLGWEPAGDLRNAPTPEAAAAALLGGR